MESAGRIDEIACSLTEPELRARRQLVRATLRPHVTSVESSEGSVDITFSSSLDVLRIEEFVALEQQCCSFLSFAISDSGGDVTLSIRGPEGSQDVLQMFAAGAMP